MSTPYVKTYKVDTLYSPISVGGKLVWDTLIF